MSYVNLAKLKGILDPTIPFFTTTLPFTTAVLIIDALTQFQSYIKAFRIVNADGTNVVTYIQGSLAGTVKTVPINSEVVANGWESFIQITPNAVTGGGFIELDLVERKYAEVS